MKKNRLPLLLVAGISLLATWQVQAQSCDRQCLETIMGNYLAGLARRDASQLPLAENYRATEDAVQTKVGEGLWKTITGLGDYRIGVADPVTGNVGVIIDIKEGNSSFPAMLRLKVVDRKITEVESVLGRGRVPGTSIVGAPRPSLAQTVPVSQRISRQQMLATANANFDAILHADGTIYAADCQRIENRMAMSGNPDLDYPITVIPGVKKPHFGSMGCKQQIEAHLFDQLDEVEPRRFVLVDEEKQLVLGVYMLRWYKKGRCSDIPDYGRICPDPKREPTALLNAELLGVRDGKIHEIEAVFKFAAYDSTSGW